MHPHSRKHIAKEHNEGTMQRVIIKTLGHHTQTDQAIHKRTTSTLHSSLAEGPPGHVQPPSPSFLHLEDETLGFHVNIKRVEGDERCLSSLTLHLLVLVKKSGVLYFDIMKGD